MAVPKGTRVGGRQKGTPNKVTVAREAEIAKSGITPLDFLLSIVRDTGAEEAKRIDAAKAAAPYVHPRLNSVDLHGKDGGPIQIIINKP